MLIWFNRNGALVAQASRYALSNGVASFSPRKGNTGVNSLYVYLSGFSPTAVAQLSITYERNGTAYTPSDIECSAIETLSIVFDRSLDILPFEYGREYLFARFDLPDGLLQADGTVTASIRFVDGDDTYVFSGIAFTIEGSALAEETMITMSQYQYLLTRIAQVQGYEFDEDWFSLTEVSSTLSKVSPLHGWVTLDTEQTVEGKKNFNGLQQFTAGLDSLGKGRFESLGKYGLTNKLELPSDDGTLATREWVEDGFGDASNVPGVAGLVALSKVFDGAGASTIATDYENETITITSGSDDSYDAYGTDVEEPTAYRITSYCVGSVSELASDEVIFIGHLAWYRDEKNYAIVYARWDATEYSQGLRDIELLADMDGTITNIVLAEAPDGNNLMPSDGFKLVTQAIKGSTAWSFRVQLFSDDVSVGGSTSVSDITESPTALGVFAYSPQGTTATFHNLSFRVNESASSDVIANPATTTETLKTVTIGDTSYAIQDNRVEEISAENNGYILRAYASDGTARWVNPDTITADKQDTLTATQLAAVNSGITANKVATYDGYQSSIDAKQDALSATQLSAVNSGITSDKVTTYDGYATGKQDTLVSGTNIKTVNGNSLLGSGDLEIEGGTEVVANPTVTEESPELNSVSIGGTAYDIPYTEVMANTDVTATDVLTNLYVDDTSYSLPYLRTDTTGNQTASGGITSTQFMASNGMFAGTSTSQSGVPAFTCYSPGSHLRYFSGIANRTYPHVYTVDHWLNFTGTDEPVTSTQNAPLTLATREYVASKYVNTSSEQTISARKTFEAGIIDRDILRFNTAVGRIDFASSTTTYSHFLSRNSNETIYINLPTDESGTSAGNAHTLATREWVNSTDKTISASNTYSADQYFATRVHVGRTSASVTYPNAYIDNTGITVEPSASESFLLSYPTDEGTIATQEYVDAQLQTGRRIQTLSVAADTPMGTAQVDASAAHHEWRLVIVGPDNEHYQITVETLADATYYRVLLFIDNGEPVYASVRSYSDEATSTHYLEALLVLHNGDEYGNITDYTFSGVGYSYSE